MYVTFLESIFKVIQIDNFHLTILTVLSELVISAIIILSTLNQSKKIP